jgi:TRAP-type transport system periplasmic protein
MKLNLKPSILCCGLILSLTVPAIAGPMRLKLATMAPEGSIWMQALDAAKEEINAASDGALKVKFYPGGIMGAEKDVLFKIKTGQLQGGGFMGYAIGRICPDARALMFPMVFMNYEEVDQVLELMRPTLEASARQNGYEAVGWTEVGFAYAYGMKPVSSLDTLRKTKVWGPDSQMLMELFKAGSIATIPANITDVLTSLQTGSLETVFGPPTAAVAVQWHTKVKSYNTLRLTYSIGGVFISSVAWNKLTPEQQTIVKEAFDKHCRLLTPKVRKSDIEALEYMQSQGVEAITASSEALADFQRIAGEALGAVKGTVFSDESWTRLQESLQKARGQ